MSARTRRDERGVSAVLVGLLLTGMVTVSAFAVDIGRAYTERRHDQNAADAAVMSGAVQAVYGEPTIQAGIDEVVAKVDATLEVTLSDAEWEACSDPDALPRSARSLGATPATDCISFSLGYEELRVRIPDQRFDTVFGSIVGVDTLETTASAQAAITNDFYGAPPFLALESARKGDFICLRTGGTESDTPLSLMDGNGPGTDPAPGTRPDPCDDSEYPVDSSTFGTVKPHAYKDACQQRNEEIKLAIAVGMDHLLGIFEGGYDPDGDGVDDRVRLDGYNNCNGILAARPNTLEVDTGFAAQDLKCALLSPKNSDTCENEYPRLRPGPESDYPMDPTVVDERFHNVAPWEYLLPAQTLFDTGAPDACVISAAARDDDDFTLSSHSNFNTYRSQNPNWQDQYWDPYDFYDTFDQCLDDWEFPEENASGELVAVDPELFELDIASSPRFAFIPQVAESTIQNGQDVHIEGWLPVFLYRLYMSKNNADMCGPWDDRTTQYMVHDAGQDWSCGSSNENVDRLSSLVFACGMVSDKLCDKETKIPEGAGEDIYEFRLTR